MMSTKTPNVSTQPRNPPHDREVHPQGCDSSSTYISKASNIKEQRKHFITVSNNLIDAIQLFGIDQKVFVDFCPMADSNDGAYWMSSEEKVINPYFGEAMLTCGEVKQIIE